EKTAAAWPPHSTCLTAVRLRGSLGCMDWHHAPLHRLADSGAYCVTAATYEKKHFFASRDRLDLVMTSFFEFARRYEWRLQAWAFFPNHYHFIAVADDANTLT